MPLQIANPAVVGKVERLARVTGVSERLRSSARSINCCESSRALPSRPHPCVLCWRSSTASRIEPTPSILFPGTSRDSRNDRHRYLGAGEIVFREPEREVFVDIIQKVPRAVISSPAVLETPMIVHGRLQLP
jgi:hypothetical protein